jgi:hypothetical protein
MTLDTFMSNELVHQAIQIAEDGIDATAGGASGDPASPR